MRPTRWSRIITSSDTANAKRTEGRNRDTVRAEYRYRKKKKKEGETIIHVTIELYTYQGTIPIIFLSLFATFTSFYPLKNFSLAE